MKKKTKIVYSICDSRHKGIDGDTPIDFFGGSFYTSSDVKKLIKGKVKSASKWWFDKNRKDLSIKDK